MTEEKLQLFLLEKEHISAAHIDQYSHILFKHWDFVKHTVLALNEGKIKGRGIIFKTVMNMALKYTRRIPYEDSEAMAAVIAERQSDLLEIIQNGH